MTKPLPENFADYPMSVAERRAAFGLDGSLWTPRDALIAMLRDIDAGTINTDALVISYRHRDETGGAHTFYRAATPDKCTALGLMELAKNLILTED